MDKTDLQSIQKLTLLIKQWNNQHFSPATSGNYSMRSHHRDNCFWVSQSGIDKEYFEEGHMLRINSNKEHLDDTNKDKKISAETDIHLYLYQKFGTSGCIIHSHSIAASFLSLKYMGQGNLRFFGLEILKAIKGHSTHLSEFSIPIVPNSQEMEEVIQSIDPLLTSQHTAFMLAGHGMYVWGSTIEEAKRHLETIEYLLQFQIMKEQSQWES